MFGTGLVKTAEDFGSQGEAPSHPELLDWLAVEFRESGWDVKKFFRLMVTSSAYRQSAVTTPLKLQKDPDNRLLSRGPRFRMDGEMVRDYALVGERPADAGDRRPEREAVSAGRSLGDGGDERIEHPLLPAGLRRQALPPQHVHLLEAQRAAGVDGHLQRADPRELHRAPRAHRTRRCRRWSP